VWIGPGDKALTRIERPFRSRTQLRARLRTDDWNRPRQPLHVVYPSNRHLSSKTRLFVDLEAEVFAPFDDR